MEKYRIKADNMINIDEKGILIGRQHKDKRIVTQDQYKKGQVPGNQQDGGRELVTALCGITAVGRSLTPGIILQAESSLVREHWVRDYDTETSMRALWASTPSGFVNSRLAYDYLVEIERQTRSIGGQKRLLFLDGHRTYLQPDFLNYCDQHDIIIALLPSYSTHMIQPLDVGVFSPLATAYSTRLEQKTRLLGLSQSISKADFWNLFEGAWRDAATVSNIKAAWKRAGLYPFEPDRVLSRLPEPEEVKKSLLEAVEAKRSTRQHDRRAEPVDSLILELERLSFQLKLAHDENAMLQAQLTNAKKAQPRTRPLLLPGVPGVEEGVFLSPSKIAAARNALAEKEADEKREAEAKLAAKEDRAAAKQLKIDEANYKRRQREEKRAEKLLNDQKRKEEITK
jgi:hypothetical protein